jgi:acetyl-CoA carboxylase/biotin carboxylase 1
LIEIKFRRRELERLIARTDETCAHLKSELDKLSIGDELRLQLQCRLEARQRLLEPVYRQIVLHFADLHDRADRMKAKNAIREIVPWPNARRFFYWRLRVRLMEEQVRYMMSVGENGYGKLADVRSFLRQLIPAKVETDRAVVEWFEANSEAVLAAINAHNRKVRLRKISQILADIGPLTAAEWGQINIAQ